MEGRFKVKKIIASVLIVCFILALCGCQSNVVQPDNIEGKPNILGTWLMVEFINGDGKKQTFNEATMKPEEMYFYTIDNEKMTISQGSNVMYLIYKWVSKNEIETSAPQTGGGETPTTVNTVKVFENRLYMSNVDKTSGKKSESIMRRYTKQIPKKKT